MGDDSEEHCLAPRHTAARHSLAARYALKREADDDDFEVKREAGEFVKEEEQQTQQTDQAQQNGGIVSSRTKGRRVTGLGDGALALRQSLLQWFATPGVARSLPWRRIAAGESLRDVYPHWDDDDQDQETKTQTQTVHKMDGSLYRETPGSDQRGYAVWVSEIMLQQTRVATVIDYYERWMKKWPTVQHLAAATLDEINEAWSGLGYYRRGKFLHEAAQQLVAAHERVSSDGGGTNGQGGPDVDGERRRGGDDDLLVPTTKAGLLAVKGIGDYTAGAVASIAYGEAVPVVDGNVIRVFSRLLGTLQHPSDPVGTKLHWATATLLLSGGLQGDGVTLPSCSEPGALNQALMELGATVCTPKSPSCGVCPVSDMCQAYAEEQAHDIEGSTGGSAARSKTAVGREGNEETVVVENVVDVEDCTLCRATNVREVAQRPTASVTKFPMQKPKAKVTEYLVFCALVARGIQLKVKDWDVPGDSDEIMVSEQQQQQQQQQQQEFLLQKRPANGLLPNLLEFTQVEMEKAAALTAAESPAADGEVPAAALLEGQRRLAAHLVKCGVGKTAERIVSALQPLHAPRSPVTHVFSHRRHEIFVFFLASDDLDAPGGQADALPPLDLRWLSLAEVDSAAISTSVRKCAQAHQQWEKNGRQVVQNAAKRRASAPPARRKRAAAPAKKQNTLESFFAKPKAAESLSPSRRRGTQESNQGAANIAEIDLT